MNFRVFNRRYCVMGCHGRQCPTSMLKDAITTSDGVAAGARNYAVTSRIARSQGPHGTWLDEIWVLFEAVPCRWFTQCQAIPRVTASISSDMALRARTDKTTRIVFPYRFIFSPPPRLLLDIPSRYNVPLGVLTKKKRRNRREKEKRKKVAEDMEKRRAWRRRRILTRKRENNRNPGRAYYARIRSIRSAVCLSSVKPFFLSRCNATLISKTSHLFLTVPLIIPQRVAIPFLLQSV